MYVCKYVCMYVCIHVSMCPCIHVSMYPCIHVSMYPCIHVSMYPCIHVYMYTCIVIVLSFPHTSLNHSLNTLKSIRLVIVLSFPHTSLNHSLNTLKSIRPVISFPPLPTCKIHAKNPGQCNMGHWAQVVSPYQPTTIPKNCHKNTRCMSLAQSISIGLTSQQIIQLGQLCYPVGTPLFKHPWTDERSCKTSLHAVDICWWDHPHGFGTAI